jgi:hypothetical protein
METNDHARDASWSDVKEACRAVHSSETIAIAACTVGSMNCEKGDDASVVSPTEGGIDTSGDSTG